MDEEKDLEVPAAIPPAGTENAPERKNRRWIIFGAAAVAVAVLVAGGVCGYRAYEGHKTSVARDACQSAVADLGKAVKAYRTLLGSDDTVAALKTDAKSVKDARTVDTLVKAAKAKLPDMVRCDASKAAGLDAAATKAGKAVKTVKADAKALDAAVKAVEASRLDKTVANAEALYKATDGKVQDDKTREALKQAIAKRDADAIAKAVKAVNDSKTAKERADAEAAAKAQAEQEAAAQQQPQSQTATTGSSTWSGGTYTNGGGSTRVYTNNGGGTYHAPQQQPTYQAPQQSQQPSNNGNGGGQPYIPPTSSCTAPITGSCSSAPGGEVWW